MKYVIEVLKKKNLKKLAPFLAGFVIALLGIFGVNDLNAENIEGFIMIFGGLLATLIGIVANNDKENEDGEGES